MLPKTIPDMVVRKAPACQVALKEWALVVRALRRGQQTMLLRKGGIADAQGAFRLEAPEFFLYPTYEHQQLGLLRPSFADQTALGDQRSDGRIRLDCYAVVTDVCAAPPLERIKQLPQTLADSFIWSSDFLEKRYSYRPELPLHALLLRAYRLEKPLLIHELQRYAGCRSWVQLEESLPTAGAVPVLDDEKYERRRAELLERLN